MGENQPEPRDRDRADRGGYQGPQKRRRFDDARLHHGGKRQRKDMGRAEYNRQRNDRRAENEERKQRHEAEDFKPVYMQQTFTKEEIEAETRRPKKKVAVLIGYSGSGYRGMQINTSEKTIEGDLFAAFVQAGAISKANANDPKKSNLVRCARTDKGVHAAGNVISLKLIYEDNDIVEKINAALTPQIRVWGIIRTTGSFSCYQSCDSRWYEYLIPTHAFLPPHPRSTFAKRLRKAAEQHNDLAQYEARQEEVAHYWDEVEDTFVKPVLDELDEDLRDIVHDALYEELEADEGKSTLGEQQVEQQQRPSPELDNAEGGEKINAENGEDLNPLRSPELHNSASGPKKYSLDLEKKKRLDQAIKRLRKAYLAAKRAFRIPKARLERVATCLRAFEGNHNFHNYTIMKAFKDPSAKRLIRSFEINGEPIIIADTEWISMRVHGQSFMMHQIRKMVGMAALCVRCGTHPGRIQDSYEDTPISIPKAPGLGLLLERPVFDTYNRTNAEKFEREHIDFARFEKDMNEFKQREIYDRMFREEEEQYAFHTYMAHVDNVKESQYMYLGSEGINAVRGLKKAPKDPRDNVQSGWEEEEEDDMEAARRGEGDG